MKTKILASLIMAAATHAALAYTPSKPDACPTLAAIKSAGITEAYKMGEGSDGWLSVIRKNSFGTNVEWEFILQSGYKNKDTREVIKLANESLSSLNLMGEPQLTKEDGKEAWVCGYMPANPSDADGPLYGIALTPADTMELPTAMRIMRRMR